MKILIAVFLIPLISSCATIVKGTTETVSLDSFVKETKVIINGENKGFTPITMEISRCIDHDIIFTKKGYEDEYVQLARRFNQATLFGSILISGPIGPAIDDMSCASSKFDQTNVRVNLEKR